MLTKRNFFVMTLLIAVVFIMFMLVDISAAYLTRDSINPQAEVPVEITREQVIDAEHLTGIAADPASGRASVAIFVTEDDLLTRQVLVEWCVYNKYPCQVYTALPEAEAIAGCHALLFGPGLASDAALPRLRAYAAAGVDMVFTDLPDPAALAKSPELADFFGISGIVAQQQAYIGLHLFDDFFVGGAREYEEKDIYGEEEASGDVFFTAPYYSLRAGFLVFAQGKIEGEEDIDHEKRPPMLWRTYTGRANVYVDASPFFDGKDLMGLVTAFLSQSNSFTLYPVVNAQTVSLVDYPMLSNENGAVLMQTYTRSADALGRDVIWPGVAKLMHGTSAACNFFLAPELNMADGIPPSAEFISFYRQEIEQIAGTIGLALNRISDTPLSDVLPQSDAFLQEAMPGYLFTSAYAARDQLDALAQSELPPSVSRLSLVMTDPADGAPLLDYLSDTVLSVSFTSDGFVHESLDDLHLLCMETALGMDQQKVDISRAYYPEEKLDWNELNLRWSKGGTYRKPYRAFDAVSVYEMEKKVRTFLALDYTASLEDGVISLHVDGPEGSSFMLRLINQQIDEVEGARCTAISDTAYLIKPDGPEVRIRISPVNMVRNIPIFQKEVVRK